MKMITRTLPSRSENNFQHITTNFRIFDCPVENIIYTIRTNPYECGSTDYIEYWKINLNLLNDSGILGFFLEEQLFKSSKIAHLNDDGFVFLCFGYDCSSDHRLKNYLFLSLLKFKIKFRFDNDSLQLIYDNLTDDEKYLFEEDVEELLDDYEISKLNTAGIDNEFCDYLDACIDEDENIFPAFDDCNNWNELYQLVDSVCAKISTKWKKIRANCKRRETNYRNQGFEILSGKEALEAIAKSRTHSLLGCDTVNWCALEYNDYDDLYTFREIVDNHMYYVLKSLKDYFDMEFILSKKWALRKYHTGISGLHMPEPKKVISK